MRVSPLCVQTVVSLENGTLVQKQTWDGKETTLEREVIDGQLVAVGILFTLQKIRISFFLFFFFLNIFSSIYALTKCFLQGPLID